MLSICFGLLTTGFHRSTVSAARRLFGIVFHILLISLKALGINLAIKEFCCTFQLGSIFLSKILWEMFVRNTILTNFSNFFGINEIIHLQNLDSEIFLLINFYRSKFTTFLKVSDKFQIIIPRSWGGLIR